MRFDGHTNDRIIRASYLARAAKKAQALMEATRLASG